MSLYGVIGSFLLFIIPYIKVAWQADTVEVVNEHLVKLDREHAKVISELSASVTNLLAAVKQNGEKTESLAASVAADREKREEEALAASVASERERKREQEKRAARWF
jgi:uncharacterized coiled-coil protein SlyX